MSLRTFSKLSTILELDFTDTTYKYALLRAVSDICKHNTHLMTRVNDRVEFPVGLIVEKWINYYWPIFAHCKFIPQKPKEGEGKRKLYLSFRNDFQTVINFYRDKNGLSGFYLDYSSDNIPMEINPSVLTLMKKIRNTIAMYPMKHLGKSINDNDYSLFSKPQRQNPIRRNQQVTRQLILKKFGKSSLPIEYYNAFNALGDYIIGEKSILSQWSEFTEKYSNQQVEFSQVYKLLRQEPDTEREVHEVRRLYENLLELQGKIECVWSGRAIHSKEQLHVDHLIPFSRWRNNELWNLLPANDSVNSTKADKIPSVELLDQRKKAILHYWYHLSSQYPARFSNEVKLSLTGFDTMADPIESAFTSLRDKIKTLTDTRGLNVWDGQ